MLEIKQENEFFSRLLSKEEKNTISKGESASSFRVLYYGKSSVSVPFMWESQPGTPKHPSSLSSLPPLTPPPSYHSKLSTPKPKSIGQKGPNPKFFPFNIFLTRKLASSKEKSHVLPSFSSPSVSSSSCSSSSLSSSSMSMNPFVRRRGCLWRSRSTACRFGVDVEDEPKAAGSPTSTLTCFGGGGRWFFKEFRGSRSRVNVNYPL